MESQLETKTSAATNANRQTAYRAFSKASIQYPSYAKPLQLPVMTIHASKRPSNLYKPVSPLKFRRYRPFQERVFPPDAYTRA